MDSLGFNDYFRGRRGPFGSDQDPLRSLIILPLAMANGRKNVRTKPAQRDAPPDTASQQSVAWGLPEIESVSVGLIALDRLSSIPLSNHS